MIEEILTTAKESTYDFRATAYPEDPLRHLFPEWLPYYRMKWAIAAVLRPTSILEIGVRFGYSALAFLHACPTAHYLGLDIDSEAFGGSVGAIDWAHRATEKYQAELMVLDSTKIDRFPGDRFDLIHIDGQQDGEGTTHDLVLAAAQANYILVDGYFWSRQNFLSASEFLYRYREIIEYYQVIPSYAGELLIKMKSPVQAPARQPIQSSVALQDFYTKDYYLSHWSGYELFKRTSGGKLEDPRLLLVARLCSIARVGRALDFGCGRGELTLELARRGFTVTAIDYSEDAIEIARQAISHHESLSSSISLDCSDVNRAELQGPYSLAVAADLIERMLPSEVDKLYRRIAQCLTQDGLFVVRTYPNLWHYKYDYQRKLKAAKQLEAYLPTEPRSRYEILLSINEQSPRILKRQLQEHFSHVSLWFGSSLQTGENIWRQFSVSEMRAAPDLIAVASHSPIPVDKIQFELRMEAISATVAGGVEFLVLDYPTSMRPRARYTVSLEVHNRTSTDLKSLSPYPIHLSYHWIDLDGQHEIFEGERTPLKPDARAGSSAHYEMSVTGPETPGNYLLRVTLVQESIRWFDQAPIGLYHDLRITCAS